MSHQNIKIAGKFATAALLAAMATYFTDWAAWRMRFDRRAGIDQVEVSRVSVASLKGNKEEYYADQVTVPCSRSFFPLPDAGSFTSPCWWLRRHRLIVEHD